MMTDNSSDLYDFLKAGTTDVFEVPMQFAHFKTPISVGDVPAYTEPITVTFREQTMAEKCDVASLVVTTYVADQSYEVTKDNLAKTSFGKTVLSSTLTDCTVTTTLEIKNPTTGVWSLYTDATSDYPFIATYDGATCCKRSEAL